MSKLLVLRHYLQQETVLMCHHVAKIASRQVSQDFKVIRGISREFQHSSRQFKEFQEISRDFMEFQEISIDFKECHGILH